EASFQHNMRKALDQSLGGSLETPTDITFRRTDSGSCIAISNDSFQCADGWRRKGQKTSRYSKDRRSDKEESGRESIRKRLKKHTRIERKVRPLEKYAIGCHLLLIGRSR